MRDSEFAQTRAEEWANATSHALGLVAALIATPFLFNVAMQRGAVFVVGVAIFVATMLLLYLGSAVYHAWPAHRFKHALRVLDHSAIFLLIAGTYTPFALGPLRGAIGWTLLALVWTFAFAGVALKLRHGATHRPRLSIALYLAMGWLALLFARPFVMAVPLATVWWIVAGGIAYTGGVIFFLHERSRYMHAIWHLFVIGGTSCHFCALLTYAQVRG